MAINLSTHPAHAGDDEAVPRWRSPEPVFTALMKAQNAKLVNVD